MRICSGAVRESTKGEQYGMWKLTDMAGSLLTLFVFGAAYAGLQRTVDDGACICIASPKIVPRKEVCRCYVLRLFTISFKFKYVFDTMCNIYFAVYQMWIYFGIHCIFNRSLKRGFHFQSHLRSS